MSGEARRKAGAGAFSQQDWVDALRTGKAIYRLGELARIAGHAEPAARRAAHRLAQRGWLTYIGKGLYANMLQPQGPPTVEDAAAILYPPAYISLESALFAHGIADQAPHVLTCVSTNKTKRFRTGLGEIDYRHVKRALFFGYTLEGGVPWAAAEKAALDFIYLELRSGRRPLLDEWHGEELDLELLRRWVKRYPGTVADLLEELVGGT